MRVVLYDDESLEPITVVNIPLPERDMLARRIWRIYVPEPMPLRLMNDKDIHEMLDMEARIVTVEFEPFQRNSSRHGVQRSVFAFTRAPELAMMLNPAWLPGQRRAVEYLMEQNDFLTDMLMSAIWRPDR